MQIVVPLEEFAEIFEETLRMIVPDGHEISRVTAESGTDRDHWETLANPLRLVIECKKDGDGWSEQ